MYNILSCNSTYNILTLYLLVVMRCIRYSVWSFIHFLFIKTICKHFQWYIRTNRKIDFHFFFDFFLFFVFFFHFSFFLLTSSVRPVRSPCPDLLACGTSSLTASFVRQSSFAETLCYGPACRMRASSLSGPNDSSSRSCHIPCYVKR